MKKIILFCLISLHLHPAILLNAQIVPPEHVTFAGMELRAKETRNVVFAVQTVGNQENDNKNDDWQPLGSGFFVAGKDNMLLGVTCYHIVKNAAEMKKPIFLGCEDKKEGYIRLPCMVEYIDPTNDIAVLRPHRGQHKVDDPSSVKFSKDMIGTNKDLVVGRGIIIPGYPLGLGVTADKNYPVMRFGIIAQYAEGDSFLIDGVASHGNSGSPVCTLLELKVVGMVTSHQADRITLFDENGQKVASLPYNAGLAQAVSADVIKRTLDAVEKKGTQPANTSDMRQ